MLKSKGSNKRVGKSWTNDIGIFLLLFFMGLFMVFPIYLAVVNSIKPVQEVFLMPPKLYAMDPTTENFRDLFKIANNSWVPFSRNIFNSVFVTVVATVLHVLFASTAAFVLSKCRFPGFDFLNQVVVIALLFNSTVLYIMQYMVMATLGMINTYSALILPIISTSMGLYLMRQSMTTIPDAMIEAAKVDGAGLMRICWGVVMPNCKPALMTIIIFEFQTAWNANGGGLVYDEALKTIPVVVQQIAAAGIARQGAIAASAVVLMIPPLLVFVLAQRNVMETMAHAGMKD
ncbi:MAG: carbohydrate ABC transporter permease [Ruminococcus sp.]|nr:carbohydrate ABC transporter permease [Ruminococcus sp.]MBQ5316492.1 carbohydrate ABC transporter permease [Oscillospiraceae bacterium]